MKYEVILFDADETLFDFKKSEKEALRKTMIKFNIKYNEDYHLKLYKDINAVVWNEFEQEAITHEKLNTERFKRLLNKLNLKFDEIQFSKAYIEYLSESSFLFKDSINLIKKLNKLYKLAIITNGLAYVQNKRIRESTIANYFDLIVISEEIMLSKPNPKIFEYTLKNMKVHDKSKVLMVGDNIKSDIQGGINFGIDTCWYNPNKIKNKILINPTYEVFSFDELNKLLTNI